MFDDDWDLFNRRLMRQKADVDIGSFLNTHFSEEKYRELRRKITAFVQGYDAADINEASALSLKQEWAETDDAHQYRRRSVRGSRPASACSTSAPVTDSRKHKPKRCSMRDEPSPSTSRTDVHSRG